MNRIYSAVGMLKTALKELGFYDVYETAIGADMGAMTEAEHYCHRRSLPCRGCPNESHLLRSGLNMVAADQPGSGGEQH